MKKNIMKLRVPKKRKGLKIKYFVYIFLIYMIFSYTFYYSMKNNKSINNEEFINLLLSEGNSNILYEHKLIKMVNSTINYFLKIDLTNPSSLLNTSILGSKESSNEIVIEHNDDYSNLEELKKISSYISDPNHVDINNPIIYLYNTHQLENYDNTNLEIYGITPNVLMASYLLKEKLNKLGLATIVEDTNLTEFLSINGWDYNSSYKASRILLLDKKNKYSSLTFYIDIHRDSVSRNLSTINLNGKSYAKILFVIGLENSNYEKNLSLATNLNNLFNKHYPNLSRGILKKEGMDVDGVYNQDISANVVLIEVGALENNIDEVFNTLEAIANVLYLYIGDNNEKK